jgi:SAM-dependent methyltransferase
VRALRELLACPACGAGLGDGWTCVGCGAGFSADGPVPDLRLIADRRTEAVRRFYEAAPFPGYPPNDSLTWLRTRAERSDFARRLDAAVPGDARIVEVGCGTGQMSLYLARADRLVVGADLTRASLTLAAAAATRFGVTRAMFVETDLRRPGLKPGAFDVVYCSGVLHHTPDPRASFRSLVRLARPGGVIVLGLYNAIARIPQRLRRGIARLTGERWIPFDPVLRERTAEPARREAWLRDQYRHPEEHRHTHGEVLRWFAENDVDYLRAYPSTVLGDDEEDLFAPAADRWPLEAWLAQIAWTATLGREGGLFVMIGRRRPEVCPVLAAQAASKSSSRPVSGGISASSGAACAATSSASSGAAAAPAR